MKSILAAFVATAISAQVGATPIRSAALLTVPSASVHQARAAEVCGFPVVPLSSGQYVREMVIAAVYSNTTGPNVPNAVPLYRLYSAAKTDHFVTTSWDEVESAVNTNGYAYEGIGAYVYPAPEAGCGAVALYREYSPQLQDHYYDILKVSANSTKTGYIYEGITAAYVFPPQ